jgi:hypothetical protein
MFYIVAESTGTYWTGCTWSEHRFEGMEYRTMAEAAALVTSPQLSRCENAKRLFRAEDVIFKPVP